MNTLTYTAKYMCTVIHKDNILGNTIFPNYPLLLCLSPTVSQYRWTYALSVAVNEDGNSNSRR